MPLPSPRSRFGFVPVFAFCVGIVVAVHSRSGDGASLIQVALATQSLLSVAAVSFGAYLQHWGGFIAAVPVLVV